MAGRWVRAVGLAGAGLTVGYLAGRRRAIAQVKPELRSPALYAPFDVMAGPRQLRAMRALLEHARLPSAPGIDVDVRTLPADDDGTGRQILLHEPPHRTRPSGAVLWIHGGGLILGHPRQDSPLCGRIAQELGVLVAAVDYRLAPEHPFPAALDDCYAALGWLHSEADALGIDPTRIAVAGASAGGGLAAALCQRAYDLGEVDVCFQLLQYPMLDDRTLSRDGERGRLMWTPALNRFGWTSYLGHPAGDREPPRHAVPARRADLTGLPPAWIGVGDLDLFYAESTGYASRLQAAGVPCTLHIERGMYHGADAIVPDAPTVRAFHDRMIEALRPSLAPR